MTTDEPKSEQRPGSDQPTHVPDLEAVDRAHRIFVGETTYEDALKEIDARSKRGEPYTTNTESLTMLTLEDAAEELGISQYHLEEAIKRNWLAVVHKDAGDRITVAELQRYTADEKARREAALAELMRLSNELGLDN